jgi:hypothetical protein
MPAVAREEWVNSVIEELEDALVGNIEEPAGHGAGFGVTTEGSVGLAEVIDRMCEPTRRIT